MKIATVAVAALVSALAVACHPGTMAPSSPSKPELVTGLHLDGDPESTSGASWRFDGTVDGVRYDLEGILLKPSGRGPFPAVLISHGGGGSAGGFSLAVATRMVQWGLVCIATNYTHAGGVAIGLPGSITQPGASTANVQRAHLARELLGTLPYVDVTRVAAHGHSMGAFVTAAVVGAYPSDFRVASHTAGGLRPDGTPDVLAAPTESQVRTIRAPYQMHHGIADFVVLLLFDQLFAEILAREGVEHELYSYSAGHNDVSFDSTMFERVRRWYQAHGMF